MEFLLGDHFLAMPLKLHFLSMLLKFHFLPIHSKYTKVVGDALTPLSRG
jgi:hypothetical protein